MRKSTHTGEYATLRASLVAIRQKAGISQRELARRLQVPHTWVAKVESGERRIDLIEFAWFCSACGTIASKEAARLMSSWRSHDAALLTERVGRRR
ncbi:MAG TPA: helix-turn-helix transcriptional regulator [Tepidisphaeraceae bacterium]|jgi:transcriptional regulator with XRE-family HTH domain|nr:helix-turn-helix transcriptional regulator [Tepidisphaeraceae bacterium]